jgi:hypothetical protein
MTRFPDWQSRLSDYLVRTANRPFQYGVLDCGLFVAGAIEAMTGVDVADGMRGKYSSRKTAFAAIRSLCGRASMTGIADYLAERHGIEETLLAFAQRGDVVQLHSGTIGLVAMHGTEILVPCADGILRLPLSYAIRAWRI